MSTGHEDAQAWIQWMESTEGQICNSGSASHGILEHRLWRAFLAGRHEGINWTGGTAKELVAPTCDHRRKNGGCAVNRLREAEACGICSICTMFIIPVREYQGRLINLSSTCECWYHPKQKSC